MTEQRRLAAIVSADVAGYSRLMGRDESGTLAALKALRQEVVDPAIASHGGRIVKTTGDGLLLEFPSVVNAVRCAVEVQTAMAAKVADVPEDRRIAFRVGINIGDIIIDGDDIFGDGVNVAARLQEIAAPGGICISSRVYDDVRDRIGEAFSEGREQTLKNIARPLRVHDWQPADGKTPIVRPLVLAKRGSRPLLAALAVLLVLGAVGLWAASRLTVVDAPNAAFNPAPSASTRTSIAVLPFVNQSGDAAQDYFGDGLTEDLIGALGRFPELAVVARNASFSYKGKTAGPADIGRELNVRYLVEGSVRRSASRVRVSAQLSDAATGKLLWSQQYDEEFRDLFSLQDSVTRQVAGTLAVNLVRIEQQRASTKPTGNLDAYDLVLRGREKFRLATRSGNRQARQLFEQAIQLDSRYADAYAALGRAFAEMATVGWTEDIDETTDKAAEFAHKAVTLEANNLDAISLLAWVHTVRGQYDLALADSDRALTINPSHADSMFERAAVLTWIGRIEDAVTASDTALRFDPNPKPGQLFSIAMAYYEARRHAEAVQLLERNLQRYPTYSFSYAVLAASYGQMGRMPEAAQALAQLRRFNPFFAAAAAGTRFQNQEHRAYFIEGLRKAGLQ